MIKSNERHDKRYPIQLNTAMKQATTARIYDLLIAMVIFRYFKVCQVDRYAAVYESANLLGIK